MKQDIKTICRWIHDQTGFFESCERIGFAELVNSVPRQLVACAIAIATEHCGVSEHKNNKQKKDRRLLAACGEELQF